MSAELLRRAAAKLRKYTAALPIVWHDRPWSPVFTDSESLTGVRACRKTHTADMEAYACDLCEDVETYSEGMAVFVALMQPAVALALADLLDAYARLWAAFEDEARRSYARSELLDVARAVLREDGEQR